MTAAADVPAEELAHAAALTEGDLDALELFLTARTKAVWLEHTPDSDESCAATAVEHVLGELFKSVRAVFRYDDGSPEMLKARRHHWNQLLDVASYWDKTDGYNQARWRRACHTDAAGVEAAAGIEQEWEEQLAAHERAKLLRSMG